MAWTAAALAAHLALLEADSRLSIYVDTFQIRARLRDDELPAGMTRHALILAPGSLTSDPQVTSANDEVFTVIVRHVIACWTSDEEDLLTDNDTSGGLGSGGSGGSQVGLLVFMEDTANAVRKATLSDLVQLTGMEQAGFDSIAIARDERDRMFLIHDATVSWSSRAPHDPTLRS